MGTTPKRRALIATAIVEEGHTVLEFRENASSHIKVHCEDVGGNRFHLSFAGTPRYGENVRILRRYVRQGYDRYITRAHVQGEAQLTTVVDVRASADIFSYGKKTPAQLVFEEQSGKLQRQYVQGLLEGMHTRD